MCMWRTRAEPICVSSTSKRVPASVFVEYGIAGSSMGLRMPWVGTLRHALASAVMAAAIAPLRDLFVVIPVAVGACAYALALISICPRDSLERRLLRGLLAKFRLTSGVR